MNKTLSNRINNLSESQTLAMTRLSRELQAEGKDVISLSIGEPDFDTPQLIKDAAKKAIDENYTHYTPVPGYPELRKAAANKLKRDNNLDYSFEQIVVSTGAKHSLTNLALSILNPGEEVILLAPYWVSYIEMIKIAEATPVIVNTTIDTDFKITIDQLKNAITPKTRMIWFSSPCNPSGSVYTKEELLAIAELVKNYPDIIIVSDEIYEHINFVGKHESIAQFDFIKDQVVVVNGVSKGFAMTGWRIGFIAAPKWIADACTKMQGQFTSGTCSIAQKAAQAALEADTSIVNDMVAAFQRRKELVYDLMKDIPGIKMNQPKGAFYFFPDVSSYYGKSYNGEVIKDATDLCMFLLNKGLVALVSGDAFGNPECLRISYATSEEVLKESINRIKNTLALLK
ncbi:MAG: pyridoxal phosphate-dependent aminotransferase [Flavobacteriales bacterium]|nr:pyridoxal phosphate-dependent aminotransferase [Flavobacteriales bacterium]MCW8912117.1 pyridoxal phosphate-dependent aminotransferase [Flavobacteriales bacterium]MCW8936757.1 pyridoxal phosphate-dependent aminotransferase [Flavobacteriales bacterium]MCW8967078.1 pyridoxal phosphate-dependent aminotransferase [Flavobacteriales bacterium]MCW8989736.1 pyridoxal phosphate-dependent aminotransferase [Flavobacteriales bacterium]